MSHDWMRNDKVDILKYLPPFLGKDKSFKAANNADSTEHDAIRADLQDLLDQLYVVTAAWGIEKWEELVDIAPQDSTDIAARRAAVLLKLKMPPGVTVTFLEKLINQYIADKSGTVTYIPAHIGAVYKAHTLTGVENHIAMLKSTVKTIDVYPAAVEQIQPESTFYVALAMTTTEELTLQIGGI